MHDAGYMLVGIEVQSFKHKQINHVNRSGILTMTKGAMHF
jgi:hypothetical protein